MGLTATMVWGRGVDCHQFAPDRRSEVRRLEDGSAAAPLVLHVGRLAVEKDPETLIAAFRAAHAILGPEAGFIVAGDGPKGAQVREALPFAHHSGFLSRGALADLYADADLFVFPSATDRHRDLRAGGTRSYGLRPSCHWVGRRRREGKHH
jgi:glycosyltransferase involved in cell wall biosynthesis